MKNCYITTKFGYHNLYFSCRTLSSGIENCFCRCLEKTYAPLLQTQCYFRSLIESLDFCLIFVFLCKKLQNWSHTIWSTNDIKVFDVDGSSNFIPACWGVFFCNLPWFFFVFAGRAEAAVSWSSVVQSSTMCRNGCMGNTVYNFAIITNFTYL